MNMFHQALHDKHAASSSTFCNDCDNAATVFMHCLEVLYTKATFHATCFTTLQNCEIKVAQNIAQCDSALLNVHIYQLQFQIKILFAIQIVQG